MSVRRAVRLRMGVCFPHPAPNPASLHAPGGHRARCLGEVTLRSQEAGFAAPEVVVATEPEAPVAYLVDDACRSLHHSLIQSR